MGGAKRAALIIVILPKVSPKTGGGKTVTQMLPSTMGAKNGGTQYGWAPIGIFQYGDTQKNGDPKRCTLSHIGVCPPKTLSLRTLTKMVLQIPWVTPERIPQVRLPKGSPEKQDPLKRCSKRLASNSMHPPLGASKL